MYDLFFFSFDIWVISCSFCKQAPGWWMWGLCAHLSSHLSLSEPPGEWWSPWKFGDLIQEPLPRPVDLHVHFFLKIPFKSISHFAQINIWNLGHVILLFKKKIYWPALIMNYFVIIILKVHTQWRILMGSAYLWEALQPGSREISADVASELY